MLCMIPNTFKEVNIVEERNEQVVEEVKEAQVEEAVTPENSEETVEEKVRLLFTRKVDELQAKLTETEGRTLRLQADFENYKRRVQMDKQAAEKYRAQSLVSDILPLLIILKEQCKWKRLMSKRNHCYKVWRWCIVNC